MTVLVIAAHADDETLGCGGTIARWVEEGQSVHVLLIADGESSRLLSGTAAGVDDLLAARNSAAQDAGRILGCESVEALGLPDNRLDGTELLDIVKHCERAIERIQPHTVLTHHFGDVNIDHQVVHNAVLAACRPQPGHPVSRILFFELPSSTEWRPGNSGAPFCPTVFVDVSAQMVKKRAAMEVYAREMRPFPHARSITAVEALATWRGATVGVEAAEAFMLGREIIRR